MTMNSMIVYNLTFTEKECEPLTDFLKDNEYPDSPEGIKELLLDIASGRIDNGSGGNPIMEAVKENPEALFDMGKSLLGAVKKIKFKKR